MGDKILILPWALFTDKFTVNLNCKFPTLRAFPQPGEVEDSLWTDLKSLEDQRWTLDAGVVERELCTLHEKLHSSLDSHRQSSPPTIKRNKTKKKRERKRKLLVTTSRSSSFRKGGEPSKRSKISPPKVFNSNFSSKFTPRSLKMGSVPKSAGCEKTASRISRSDSDRFLIKNPLHREGTRKKFSTARWKVIQSSEAREHVYQLLTVGTTGTTVKVTGKIRGSEASSRSVFLP